MDFSSATLKEVSVHYVGNKGNGQELVSSAKPLVLDEVDKRILCDALLARFTTDMEKYSFHHQVSLNYNEIYGLCLNIFAEEAPFHKSSMDIARHLYESSTHPKIKDGELYVCHFENCIIAGASVEAIGIYKTENKSNFLDLQHEAYDFNITLREGVELSKLDKGCLALPTNGENGFDVLLFDNNRGEEAQFWKETFLSVAPQANEYYQTNQFLTMTRQFIAKQVPTEFEIEKTEQIDMLNKSVEYFRANEAFSKQDFVDTVLKDDRIKHAFKKYEDNYAEMNDVEIPDTFDISTQAVKRQARVFKSVLKLDRNFHIYIHGDKDLIEKGYDASVGKNYYKIYYDEET